MSMALSRGGTYPHDERPAEFGLSAATSAGSCVWPTETEVTVLGHALAQAGCTSLVSIGCGVGLLEGLLQRVGIPVTAVDLETAGPDPFAYQTAVCFCEDITRVPHNTIFDIASGPAHGSEPVSSDDLWDGLGLLVCYGKRVPLDAYIAAFPELRIVAIIGDRGGITTPSCDALLLCPEWRVVREVCITGAVGDTPAVVYRRCRVPPDPTASPAALDV
eukprot:m.18075 g.18075  ORF g.18075 m.18075 type:complete len:218 (+) comp9518_c0_seq1:325-978(+)